MTGPQSRAWWAAAAFAIYAGAIVLSNYLIVHVGIPAGPGTHLTPVGFGLLAPSGVWAAAVSFPARDVVQRLTPRRHVTARLRRRWSRCPDIGVPAIGIAAVLIGAAISYAISSPVIAVASGITYLCSESLDMAVYTPLQRRWFVPAVLASGCAAVVLDSVLFLHLAGLYSTAGVEGLILGKFWVVCVATVVTWVLRKRGPLAVQAVTA